MPDRPRTELPQAVSACGLPAGLETAIARRAAAADAGQESLQTDLEELDRGSFCTAPLPTRCGGAGLGTEPAGTERCLAVLRALGRANLSVARLYEGHINAIKLVVLYGTEAQIAAAADAARKGHWFGVWGADGAVPVSMTMDGTCVRLAGAKRFASGLGMISRAVVTARHSESHGDAQRLLIAPVDEPARQDASGWRTSGMRATISGTYDFDGVVLPSSALLGDAGDYIREPFFEGGTWRYCAAHLGGAEAIYDMMLGVLIDRGIAEDPHQGRRLAKAAIAVETARLWTSAAAARVEAAGAAADTAAYALLGREAVEEACLHVMAIAERALGTMAHFDEQPIERVRRDLGFFLRQAALDAKLARAAAVLVRRRCSGEML